MTGTGELGKIPSMKEIPIQTIRSHLAYCPETGNLTWLVSKRGHRKAGDLAGSWTKQGYRRVKVNQVAVPAHRAAWAIHYGEWPTDEIDHVNGDRGDNRLSNLRLATRHENCQNVPGAGVRYEADRGKWLARITYKRIEKNLGRYETEAEARAAYIAASRALRGDFHRG